MKINVYSQSGEINEKIDLPDVFTKEIRFDLIKRAALSDMSYKYQPKGADPSAGLKTSAEYVGRKGDYGSSKNHGIAMLPREKLPNGRFGKVRRIPSAVGGRRAFPPKPEKKLIELMNRKEYLSAIKSAISATKDIMLAKKRGHVFSIKEIPIILDESCNEINKTKDVKILFEKLGIYEDILKSHEKRKAKSGKRGYGTKTPVSILIVTSTDDSKLLNASRNLSGVDAISIFDLTVEMLAPGTEPGRLCVFTKKAIEEIEKL